MSGGDESPDAATPAALRLEAEGWRAWLTTIFPFAFEEEFSDDHTKFWDLFWSVLLRIREQRKYLALGLPHPKEFDIDEEEYVVLLVLGRGLGKSQTIEASSVMRGAILGGGYTLYVCEAQDQANEHIGNCRDLIENPESRIAEFYPGMRPAVRRQLGKKLQSKGLLKWAEDLFVTASGWICRAKGLNSKLRGIRIGTRRPDDINVDDIDGVNDSIDVSLKKLKQLTASVFPTQARRFASIKFGQNLITEHSVMNQIYTGKSDALAARTAIGVTNTFVRFEEGLDYVTYQADDGRTRHRILESAVTTWNGVDLAAAQKFLNDSGLATFLAEYMNCFEHLKEGRVLRNWDDALMVIRKSDFARVYGSREVAPSWYKYQFHDWSKTKNAYHACVAGKVTVAGKNTPLPGKVFAFDMMSFPEQTQADDVARRILESISPTVPGSRASWKELIASSYSRANLEQYVADSTRLIEARRAALSRVIPAIVQPLLAAKNYVKFRGSNEQNKDVLKVYRDAFGLPFSPANPTEQGGLDWLDHYMMVDKTTRHPFFEDAQLEDGTWTLGCPGFFLIVEDDKYEYPTELQPDLLHDSDLARYQFNNWRTRPAVLNAAGFIEYGPMKMNDDFGQGLQMLFHDNCVQAAPLTREEKIVAHLPEKLQPQEIAKVEDPTERARRLQAQVMQRQKIEKEVMRPKGGSRNALAGLRSLAARKR